MIRPMFHYNTVTRIISSILYFRFNIRLTMHVGTCNAGSGSWVSINMVDPNDNKRCGADEEEEEQGIRSGEKDSSQCAKAWLGLQNQYILQHFTACSSYLVASDGGKR